MIFNKLPPIICKGCNQPATNIGELTGIKDGKEYLLMKYCACQEHYDQIMVIVKRHGKRLKAPVVIIEDSGKN